MPDSTMSELAIDVERLEERLGELGAIGRIAGTHGCSRLALTPEDGAARDLVVRWMRALDLDVAIDRIGNIVATQPGAERRAPVLMGSHIDTVRAGGRYDGNLGVVAGLEVVAALQARGVELERPLGVAVFTNEEGARFAPDMLGSLVHVGGLALEDALAAEDADGQRLGDALERIGYRGSAPVPGPVPHAFVELHIEQGPVLEAEGVTVGAVTGVQGISWTRFDLAGQANHAGTTPMSMRRDAGLVAAAIAVRARALARELGGAQVATVGRVDLSPNLVNVVPSHATLTVDLRNTDEARLAEAEQRLFASAAELAAGEGVALERRSLARFEPVAFDERVVALVESEARARGHRVKRLPSGAGHDAQMLARVCPTGMVFVPSVDGISHNPAERTHPADLAAGAGVLCGTVRRLAATTF